MASYNALESNTNNPSPYGSGDPYYNQSTGYITPQPMATKKRTSNWLKFGLPVLIIVIIAAVVGGVVGSRKSNKEASTSGGGSAGSGGGGGPAASSVASVKSALGRYATATDSKYLIPIYPSTVSGL